MTTTTVAPATLTCADTRCTNGVTMCRGCNGWGVLKRNGHRIRMRRDTTKYPLSESLPGHHECNATGMVACGCMPLDVAAQITLAGTMPTVEVKRYSTEKGEFVTVGRVSAAPVAPAPVKPAATTKPKRPARPKDPVTGRFLRKDAAQPGTIEYVVERLSRDDLMWITSMPRDPNARFVDLAVPGQSTWTNMIDKGVIENRPVGRRKWLRLTDYGHELRTAAWPEVRERRSKSPALYERGPVGSAAA